MEPIAYGALALKPWEFGRLTPSEFEQLVDGYIWRTEQEQFGVARFVAPIINTCTSYELKRPVTVEMLMGREPKKKHSIKTTDQMQHELKELMAKVG